MPRVVPDQRSKFENEEFFRKLSRECEIKYTGFRDRPHEERQARFQNACRDGRSEVLPVVAVGDSLWRQCWWAESVSLHFQTTIFSRRVFKCNRSSNSEMDASQA